MKRKILMILLLFLSLLFLMNCGWVKNIFSPDNPDDPVKADDIVEFRYVRDLAIINPSAPDTKGPSLTSDEFGGIKMVSWQIVDENKSWQTEAQLRYSNRLYHICTIDMKVTNGYVAVADTFYGRIKGTQPWTKLSVSQNGEMTGKWADFYLNQQGLQTPSN